MAELTWRMMWLYCAILGALTIGDEIIGGWFDEPLLTVGGRAVIALLILLGYAAQFWWDATRKCKTCEHHPNAHKEKGCSAIELIDGEFHGCECKEVKRG